MHSKLAFIFGASSVMSTMQMTLDAPKSEVRQTTFEDKFVHNCPKLMKRTRFDKNTLRSATSLRHSRFIFGDASCSLIPLPPAMQVSNPAIRGETQASEVSSAKKPHPAAATVISEGQTYISSPTVKFARLRQIRGRADAPHVQDGTQRFKRVAMMS